ncbi:CpaE family protein [Paenarthrobacter sp. NPDC089989]|uniref:AAA family ATPase n=1 Tax=unclassified Paenarthrobacter TaxID=2634190 RepID=UPI00380A5633
MSIAVVTFGQATEALVGGLERLHGPVTVVRRCSELAELMAACQSGLAQAAVVSEGSGDLSASLVARMDIVGVSIVALTDDPAEAARLQSFGVTPVDVGIGPSELAGKISEAVEMHRDRDWQKSAMDAGFAELSVRSSDPVEPAVPDDTPEPGRVIAVWGPAGAPGRTTVAVNIAAELAAAGDAVILIDADTYGASAAAMLGLLDESAGLAQACRLADQGILDMNAFDRAATHVHTAAGSFRILSGITRSDRWTELRVPALSVVLERARHAAGVVVVDVGFCLESDEELSFDTMAPRRNGATLRCLELADEVIAVGAADAVGVPRLVRGLADLEVAAPHLSPRIVLNKVRQASVGRSPRRQLAEAWQRFGPLQGIEAYLPADFPACDAAMLSGTVLLESAPGSSLRSAIAGLVCASNQQNAKSAGRSARAIHLLKR